MRQLLMAAFTLLAALPLVASEEDDMTSLSYIAYLERYATIQPASQEDSLEAVTNMPLVAGDRVDTAREARLEIHLADGSLMWLDEYSSISFDALAFSRDTQGDRTVLYLAEGDLFLRIPESSLSQHPTRVDSPSATVYLNSAGDYRVRTLEDGGLAVEVREGVAEAATASGGVLIRAQSAAEIRQGDVTRLENLTWGDPFAVWVEERRQIAAGESATHVDPRFGRQAAQLDNYGTWVYLEDEGTYAWRPSVSTGWRPYTAGRWYWTSPGWCWISYEPWGWLPYHYGSWYAHASFGWVWRWGPCWGPAWVSWVHWPGYVGWCPRGYYDYWYWNSYYPHGGPRPPYHPGYPGDRPGRPPRRDVLPPRDTVSTQPAPRRRDLTPDRYALDLRGRAKLDQIDPSAWNVVSDRDFDSPNLARLVRPGEEALRGVRDTTGVVRSGPLVTESPARSSPRREIERVFQRTAEDSPTDVTPILRRDSGLPTRDAQRLVSTTTPSELSRRARLAPGGSADPSRALSGLQRPSESSRRAEPNIHRSTSRLSTSSGLPTLSRRRSATSPGPFDGSSPTSGLRTAPSGRARPSAVSPPASGSPNERVLRPRLSTRGRTATGTDRRSIAGSSRSGGSRPVVVPRSPRSGSRSPSGSTVRRPSSRSRSTASRPAPRSGSSVSRPAPRAPSRPSSPPRSAPSRPTRR